MNRILRFFLIPLSLFLINFFSFYSPIYSQRIESPDGDQVLRKIIFSPSITTRLICTRYCLYTSLNSDSSIWSKAKLQFSIPAGHTIKDLSIKEGGSSLAPVILLLIDDGTVYQFNYSIFTNDLGSPNIEYPNYTAAGANGYKKLIGEKSLFVINGNYIIKNILDGSGWRYDTLGLTGFNVLDITFGNQNNLIATTNKGLFQKPISSDKWIRISSYDTLNSNSIFRTLKNELFVGTSIGCFSSIDNGNTWKIDTIGANRIIFTRFGDDNQGNIYAISAGTGNTSNLYKKPFSSTSWQRIDSNIKKYLGVNVKINDLGGDSTLELSTSLGMLTSRDFGITWMMTNKGIMADDVYGMAFLGDNNVIVSTPLGIFTKDNSENWIKTFPIVGFLSTRTIQQDLKGNLYTQGSSISQTQQNPIYKSIDKGLTWQIDTIGLSKVSISNTLAPVFFVDELGGEHIGLTGLQNPAGQTIIKSFNKSNNEWFIDTNGLGFNNANKTLGLFGNYGSDQQGNLYLSCGDNAQSGIGTTYIFKKSLIGNTWQFDTIGIGHNFINSFIADNKGNFFSGSINLGSLSNIFYKLNKIWAPMQLPPASSSDIKFMGCDSTGALFAAFGPTTLDPQVQNRGIYVTNDFGKSWDYAGLDSIIVRGLYAKNEDMYAFTGRGIFKLNRKALNLPKMSININQINFGRINSGKSFDSTATITNTGNDTLRISNITSNSAAFVILTKVMKIAPGQNQNLKITFSPTTVQNYVGTIKIISNTFPDSIILKGEGILSANAAKLTLSPKYLDFGKVEATTTKSLSFKITNTGGDTLKVSNITSSTNAFTIPAPRQFNLAPGDNKDVTITFGNNTENSYLSTIKILSNILTDSISVSGITIKKSIQISFGTINFGKVAIGDFMDSTLIITNNGLDTAFISNISSNQTVFSFLPNSIVIASNKSENIKIRFSPLSPPGKYNSPTLIKSNYADVSFILSGEGINPSNVEADIFNGIDVKIFPNPTSDNLSIQYSLNQQQQEIRFSLINLFGIEMEKFDNLQALEGLNTKELNLNDIPSGLYFINVSINKSSKLFKLEIIR